RDPAAADQREGRARGKCEVAPASTMAFAAVLANVSDRNAPATFSTAERRTAIRGASAPVAIEVAMALAVSWKPLVKSNASAVATMTTSSEVSAIGWGPPSPRPPERRRYRPL